ncbi:MAG TPA: hypothetical protein VGM98_15750 [Schlesneria sp.]|jgi:hypothetical protein
MVNVIQNFRAKREARASVDWEFYRSVLNRAAHGEDICEDELRDAMKAGGRTDVEMEADLHLLTSSLKVIEDANQQQGAYYSTNEQLVADIAEAKIAEAVTKEAAEAALDCSKKLWDSRSALNEQLSSSWRSAIEADRQLIEARLIDAPLRVMAIRPAKPAAEVPPVQPPSTSMVTAAAGDEGDDGLMDPDEMLKALGTPDVDVLVDGSGLGDE